MRQLVLTGTCTGMLLALAAVATTQAQNPPPAKSAAPPAKSATPPTKAAPAPARNIPPPAVLNQVLATVNGESITRGDLLKFLSGYEIPAGNEENIYRDAMETLVNNRLVNQFINRQKLPVSEQKIDQAVAKVEQDLKAEGRDLPTALAESNTSMADLRKEFATRERWIAYINAKGTDAELKKFAEQNKDMINGTQIRASHIVLKVDPNATPEEKEKVRQTLLGIKKAIESNKMTFAEAANKHSVDPANAEGAGGDLGYFGRNSGFIEEFTDAAFALKKGSISDPVETAYGYHLIQVTDRKEGAAIDFEKQRPLITQLYSMELQKDLIAAERKTAKIDIKPMPKDLFPPAPATPPAGTTPPATGTPPANAPQRTTPKGAAPKAAAPGR
jgi:peptidyl-prolyl cis-trans isomerase C